MRIFYHLLANNVIASITNFTVWFAIVFFAYLQTQSVVVTSVMFGVYLIAVAGSGFWLGSLVDRFPKKRVMLGSSVTSLAIYIMGLVIYLAAPQDAFKSAGSLYLWLLIPTLTAGVIAGNLRSIALTTLITILIPEERRDKANGLAGTAFGIAFLVTSVISGILVGWAGMLPVLVLAIVLTIVTIIYLWFIPVAEAEAKSRTHQEVEDSQEDKKIDIKGTLKAINAVPGLLPMILFTTFNNFLGGVFGSLMDAYGLSMVSVEAWGLIWGFLSTAFIVGGAIIAKWGLGKNPLRAFFLANFAIWTVSCLFTIQPSMPLFVVGAFIYLTVVPFIEAAEHTVIQKVVPPERQGRVFGFAQSVEQSASPITSFLIGPLAELVFIPFMTTGAGVQLIGDWFGTGKPRGIALVFTLAGIIGLLVTVYARNSKYYKQLTKFYIQH